MNKEITTLLLTISSLDELYQNCVSARALCAHVYHPSAALITTRHTHTHTVVRGGGGKVGTVLSYCHTLLYIIYTIIGLYILSISLCMLIMY